MCFAITFVLDTVIRTIIETVKATVLFYHGEIDNRARVPVEHTLSVASTNDDSEFCTFISYHGHSATRGSLRGDGAQLHEGNERFSAVSAVNTHLMLHVWCATYGYFLCPKN